MSETEQKLKERVAELELELRQASHLIQLGKESRKVVICSEAVFKIFDLHEVSLAEMYAVFALILAKVHHTEMVNKEQTLDTS